MDIVSFILIITGVIILFFVRKKNVTEWLVYVCAEAERVYGSGTGYIKLRDVYSEFIRVYPLLSILIPFDYFTKLVDKSLALLKEKLEESIEMNELIRGQE